MSNNRVFMVQACNCERCGRLLTSKQAVAEGMGHVCKQKSEGEIQKNKPISGQVSLFGGANFQEGE